MKNDKNKPQGLNPGPVKNYEAPKLPTLEDVCGDSAFLKKLPLRWKKSAAVITCAGLMGTWVFSGCSASPRDEIDSPDITTSSGFTTQTPDIETKALDIETEAPDIEIEVPDIETEIPDIATKAPDVTTQPPAITTEPSATTAKTTTTAKNTTTTQATTTAPATTTTTVTTAAIPDDEDILFKMHYGGGGSAFYMVYFTEQEALNIIRTQLEAAGLSFGATPPDYIGDVRDEDWSYGLNIGLDLFDSEKDVAIAHLSYDKSYAHFYGDTREDVAKDFERQANEQGKNTKFGVFDTKGVFPDFEIWRKVEGEWHEFKPTQAEISAAKAQARPELEKKLAAQVDKFIKFLRDEGIL